LDSNRSDIAREITPNANPGVSTPENAELNVWAQTTLEQMPKDAKAVGKEFERATP
jgi:hypothetical protein